MVMYMREPSDLSSASPDGHVTGSLYRAGCAVAGVVIFGIYPNPLVNFAMQAVSTLK